jgi:vancomycin resistance protein YoaR
MSYNDTMNSPRLKRVVSVAKWPLGILVIGFLIIAVGVPLVYQGRVYPGVVVHGVAVGGQTKAQARKAVIAADAKYATQPLVITNGTTTVRVQPSDLGVVANSDAAVDQAYKYGRSGGGMNQWRAMIRSLAGRTTTVGMVTINPDKLAGYTVNFADDAAVPVQNAAFNISGAVVDVAPAVDGKRLDMLGWVNALRWHMATGSKATITLPTTTERPIISSNELSLLKGKVAGYVAAPITLTSPDGSKTVTISQNDLVAWLGASRTGITDIVQTPSLDAILHTGSVPIIVGLNSNKVDEYVATLAGSVNQAPVNAVLGYNAAGKTTIVKAAQNGLKLDVAKTTEAVKAALDKPADQRSVTMVATVDKAEVREDTLQSLGLQDHLSAATTYFPGSPYTRLINVRAGANRFDGVMLKPGEVFSFGKLLGEVNASTGYVPELVILNNREEKQYGGGLCQVSSTAYRAALLAGLPILQRQNHSFAISYYTAPYGVPGVDATIYYPAVDMKYRNDTPGHLYMQTRMVGTTLTFDYFGTKTKYGEIRGPQFITGDNDATKPSHTVFWRDVKRLDGSIVRTDEVHTYYQSSKDFPIVPTFN